jgi:hypothetical protein
VHETSDNILTRRVILLAKLATWVMPLRAQPQVEPAPVQSDQIGSDQLGSGQIGPVQIGTVQAGPALVDYAATALTHLIEAARQQAIADGVRPIPAIVYRALLGYFPPALLQKARFASGRANTLTLPALAFTYGDGVAVTLGEVVLFKTEQSAQSDLRLWAHELTHVMQYQRWGINGFAERYVRDSSAVEREAIDNANRFMAWEAHRGG